MPSIAAGVLLSQSRFDDELKQIGLLVDRPDSRSILNVEVRDPGVNMVAGQRPTIRRSDQPLTRMAKSAVQGRTDHDVDGYRDYRGVPVVGAWQWLDDYDFGVATEIDVDEAFAPVYILRRAFAVLMGLLAAAAVGIFLAMLLIARQQRELHDAALAAQQFGQYTLVEKLGTGGMGTVYRGPARTAAPADGGQAAQSGDDLRRGSCPLRAGGPADQRPVAPQHGRDL